jgi:hypothetical protein
VDQSTGSHQLQAPATVIQQQDPTPFRDPWRPRRPSPSSGSRCTRVVPAEPAPTGPLRLSWTPTASIPTRSPLTTGHCW